MERAQGSTLSVFARRRVLSIAIGLGAACVVALAIVRWTHVSPRTSASERERGATLYAEGRFAEAVTAYENALALEDDIGTRTNLANALAASGRIDEASREYSRVLARDPKNGLAWFDLGNLLREKMHDTRGAVEAYHHATEYAPKLAEAQFNLGATLIDLHDYDAAIASIEAALQIAPADVSWRKDAENALLLAHARKLDKRDAENAKH